jgi:hypothetical protein
MIVAAIGLVLLVPQTALACPVCFGENDSPLALGINYGILAMLVIIGGLWAAFGSFFIYLRRRARLVESGALPSGGDLVDAGDAATRLPHAQEGTV